MVRGRGTSTLLLGPAMGGARFDDVDDGGERPHLLVVTLGTAPARWLRTADIGPEDVASLSFIATEGSTGRAASPVGSVRTVSSPGDLTGVGIHAVSFVEDRPEGASTVAYVDSLTVVLQYVDERTAYRFLNVVVGRFRAAGVDTYVRLAPDAVGDRSVSTFRPLFDGVVHGD